MPDIFEPSVCCYAEPLTTPVSAKTTERRMHMPKIHPYFYCSLLPAKPRLLDFAILDREILHIS